MAVNGCSGSVDSDTAAPVATLDTGRMQPGTWATLCLCRHDTLLAPQSSAPDPDVELSRTYVLVVEHLSRLTEEGLAPFYDAEGVRRREDDAGKGDPGAHRQNPNPSL
jgi:hypothetical protein